MSDRDSRREEYAHSLGRRRVSLLLSVGLAGLIASSAAPLPPRVATIQLDEFSYTPGQIPTICFTTRSLPRLAGFVGDELEVFLDFSPEPGAGATTPFPSFQVGTIDLLGSITFELDPVTCNSRNQFIQGFTQDMTSGQLVEFTNEVELVVDLSSCDPLDPPGGQGCTPAVWRDPRNPDQWPIPLLPDSPFDSVFDDAFPDKSMLEVLGFSGPPLKFFGRQTVAALLNATSPQVDYDLSVTEVIAIFNDTFPGPDPVYLLKGQFLAQLNSQECNVGDVALYDPGTAPQGKKR